jgi:two-component system chemotaxis sensor kinase CheA
VGLIVERILDVIETPVKIQCHARRAGILGSAVIQQRVTDLIDLPAVMQAAGFDAGPGSTAL